MWYFTLNSYLVVSIYRHRFLKRLWSVHTDFLKKIYLFPERGEGREKERERNINVWLLLVHPQLGTWPATQACAIWTGNWTCSPLVLRIAQPLRHTSQGFYKRLYLFIFREREGREKERERNIDVREIYLSVASHIPPTGDLACNSGMYLDWELNWQPFGLQAGTQPIEPHQPGHIFVFLRSINYFMFTRLCILF